MKSRSLIALLGACASAASAQEAGLWEDPFLFGDAAHEPIRAIDLIHIFDGTTGKFLALSEDRPDPDPATCWAGYSRVWTPPGILAGGDAPAPHRETSNEEKPGVSVRVVDRNSVGAADPVR